MILEIIKEPRASAYRLKRKNHIKGRWLRHGDNWPDWQVRLINKNKGSFKGEIHEKWITEGTIGKIDAHIEHYGFLDYAEMLETMNKYSSISAKELYLAGKRASVLSPVVHVLSMFIKIYILKRGFLDGLDGLVLALLKASGSFFKYAKLIELQREKS